MSRSFGDTVASYVGVSVYPEVKQVWLEKEDAFVVIASDGVWEFMGNEEVAEVVHGYYFGGNAEKAAEEVVKKSFGRWRENEVVVDDIT
jgi:serine/threonine protein phosphatase PrpC